MTFHFPRIACWAPVAGCLLGLALGAVLSLPLPAAAQTRPPVPAPVQVTAAQQQAVLRALGEQLRQRYVFPDVAERLAQQLQARSQAGAYASAADSQALAEALTRDLRELGQDAHFRVRFDPRMAAMPPSATPPALSAEELAKERAQAARIGYGIEAVQRLPGNIAYLSLEGFGPTDFVGEAYTAAMMLLVGSDALILDLRRNRGGEPTSVAYLLSHFFQVGDERHLNDIADRPTGQTRSYWTLPLRAPRHLGPVYVLTSRNTFSGGEECAYDLQTQKRATLIGETTGGGANPGDVVPLAEGFVAFVPTGRAINPVTGTNWEGVGVKPDVAVPADMAFKTAYTTALKARLAAPSLNPRERDEVQRALAGAETRTLPGDGPAEP